MRLASLGLKYLLANLCLAQRGVSFYQAGTEAECAGCLLHR